ncbi:MAG: hypothetical protein HGA42_13330 [Nostocales cyanobacterium W4_Combined_metabat2_030]|nr:hypothetical protein [Nostocales cyanobacterium W4_Combined_metabat2_030]
MKPFIPIAVSSIIGGIIGVTLTSPISYTLYESIPGQGYSRNCSPGDMFCNSTRSREMYSGRSYRTRSVIDSQESLQQQFIYGGIGVAAGFIPSALLMAILNRKKTKLPSEDAQ